MQTLTRTNMLGSEDYDHMTTIGENMIRMKLPYLLSTYL